MNSLRKLFFLIIGVVTLSLVTGLIATGWTGPGDAAPYSNAPAPVNIGSDSQTKDGEFISNSKITAGSFFTAGNIEGTSLDVTSFHVSGSGLVGVGTSTEAPASLLTIERNDNGVGGVEIIDGGLFIKGMFGNFNIQTSTYDLSWAGTGGLQTPMFTPKGVIKKEGQPFIHNAIPKLADETFVDGRNTFLGVNAGKFSLSSLATSTSDFSYNTALGYEALYSVDEPQDTGSPENSYNTAVGAYALNYNYSGKNNNTAIGYKSLTDNYGSENIGIGKESLSNNSGDYNIAAGVGALKYNSGDYNIAIGDSAMNEVAGSDGDYNVAIGSNALQYVGFMSEDNIAIGANSLGVGTGVYVPVNRKRNIAIGNQSSFGLITGQDNISVGDGALYSASSTSNNIAIGKNSLSDNTAEGNNIAIGIGALEENISGTDNTAIGHNVLKYNTEGKYNVGVGSKALASASGSSNTVIGWQAGMDIDGNSNIIIGMGMNAGPGVSNSIGIGAVVGESNIVKIGDTSITDTYLRGVLNLSSQDEPADPDTIGEAVIWLGNGNCNAWCDEPGRLYIKSYNVFDGDTSATVDGWAL